jgi:hypothetical protein
MKPRRPLDGLARQLLCLIGRHEFGPWHSNPPMWRECKHCMATQFTLAGLKEMMVTTEDWGGLGHDKRNRIN